MSTNCCDDEAGPFLTLVVQTALTGLRLLALLTLTGECGRLVEEDLLLGLHPVPPSDGGVGRVVDHLLVVDPRVGVEDGGGGGDWPQLTHPAPHLEGVEVRQVGVIGRAGPGELGHLVVQLALHLHLHHVRLHLALLAQQDEVVLLRLLAGHLDYLGYLYFIDQTAVLQVLQLSYNSSTLRSNSVPDQISPLTLESLHHLAGLLLSVLLLYDGAPGERLARLHQVGVEETAGTEISHLLNTDFPRLILSQIWTNQGLCLS